MDRWANKVAVVTGASSGIGAAVVKDLVKTGLIVVGLARREERLRELRLELPPNLQAKFHSIKCDVSKEEDVKDAFAWVEKNLGGTDILVNNAGIAIKSHTLCGIDNMQNSRKIIDTNLMAVVYCVREAFNSMKNRNIDGHVVIVNSVSGHKVLAIPGSTLNIYPATKFAVTAMTETYRQEFANAGTKVKITSISPGLVDTEIITQELKKSRFPFLKAVDVSNAILYILGTPRNVQIQELTIKPLGELF